MMRYNNVEFKPATENRHAEIVACVYNNNRDEEN